MWSGFKTCNLSFVAVLPSLNRFISRRGCLDNLIQTMIAISKLKTHTHTYTSNLKIKLHFNKPWYGGVFESLIRIVKSHLKTRIPSTQLNHEELYTLLLETEKLINNQLITYVYPCQLDQCLTTLLLASRLESTSLSQ